jgi:hypothetical protein
MPVHCSCEAFKHEPKGDNVVSPETGRVKPAEFIVTDYSICIVSQGIQPIDGRDTQ